MPTAMLAVVAYPELLSQDRTWLETVRASHDPQAAMIQVHFTLVFPADVPPAPLVAQVQEVACNWPRITVILGHAQALRDQSAAMSYLCLIPRSGGDLLEQLHEHLSSQPRHPFIPHITVGADSSHENCVRLADLLNQECRTIICTVDELHVIEIARPAVRTILRVPLSGPITGGPTSGST